MAQTNISIRIDEDVKKEAEALFAKLAVEADPKMQARKEFGEAIKAIQEQSVLNGTSEITLDEINEIIAECRQGENLK